MLKYLLEPLLCTQEVIFFEKEVVLGLKIWGQGGRGQTLVKRERQSSVTKNLADPNSALLSVLKPFCVISAG